MKYIFIDRDGVINKDPGGWTKYNYVTDVKDLHFLPGALDAIKLLNQNNINAIIVSNQAGVSRGYFTKAELETVNSKMLEEIGKKGGRIEAVYYCVHKDEDNCSCRKPKTGMFESAIKKYGIEPHDTFIIGDSYVDMEAGRRLGIKTIFVRSGKLTLEEIKKKGEKPDYVFENMLEAIKWILTKEKRKAERARRRKIE